MKKLPTRDRVAKADTWDLSQLFKTDKAWEKGLKELEKQIPKFKAFRGKLGKNARSLRSCLDLDSQVDRLAERLGCYAYLRSCTDQTESDAQRMLGRFQNVATRAGEATSFMRPEIMAIPAAKMKSLMESKELEEYKLVLKRLRRYAKHTLSDKEEHLLAMQGEMAGATGRVFSKLVDADLKFGMVKDENGKEVELSNSTLSQFLYSPNRDVRKTAFHQYYNVISGHQNSLAATFSGSVQKDAYYARARGYDSALAKALFPDNVPLSVYDNLISAVRRNLPAVHQYYEVRRRKMKLKKIHMYDTYVPILTGMKKKFTWKQACKIILDSLQPLGEEYCAALEEGLNGRWCDKYPNVAKRSGAFSYGVYDGPPYILMNFQPTVLGDVFTLAHEAGHSMHTYYSVRNQPFTYYDYTIFVAEVASTFNEELLSHHMLELADSKEERAYLLNRNIDAVRATIVRQTMFAEFEKIAHEMVEQGEPLTVEAVRDVYGKLLKDYFGPKFEIDKDLELECLRIPHFYGAYYVYKYATGLSAAIALSRRVLNGGKKELNQYLGFLSGGCSKDPLNLLKSAGVDLRKPEPVDTALAHFNDMVKEFDKLT